MPLNKDCIFILQNINFIESWLKIGLTADSMMFGRKDSATRFILVISPCHCLVRVML